MNSQFIQKCQKAIEQLPLRLITMKDVPEKRGALLYAGDIPDNTDIVQQWVDKAFWMLENSAVAARNLPKGRFVSLAYKGGYVIISDDIKNDLSEEMHRACQVATYSDFGINRNHTCLVCTYTPFELSVIIENDKCLAFLIGNPKADIVVYSEDRLNKMMVY